MVQHWERDIKELKKFRTTQADTSIILTGERSPIDDERTHQTDEIILISNNGRSILLERAATDYHLNEVVLEQKDLKYGVNDQTDCTTIAVDYQTTRVDAQAISKCLYSLVLLDYATKVLFQPEEDTSFKSSHVGLKLDETCIFIENYQLTSRLRKKMEEALSNVEYIDTNRGGLSLLQKIDCRLKEVNLTFVESSQHAYFTAYSNEIFSAQCRGQYQTCSEEDKIQDMPLNRLTCIVKALRKKKQKYGIILTKEESKKHLKQAAKFADVVKFVSVTRHLSLCMKYLKMKKLSEESIFIGNTFPLKVPSGFTSEELNPITELGFNNMRSWGSYTKEHYSVESIVSDPSEYGKKEDELRSISEYSYCSHKSSDVSLEEESELQRSADDAISEFRGTDCYKLDANLPITCSEPNPSGQTINSPTQFSLKVPEHSTSLELRDTKSMPPVSRWLTETFHGPIRERLSQPPPDHTSHPLTRETTLVNMRQLAWRLASMLHLRDFPVRHREMAVAGWFYDEDVDEFRCYCCPATRSTGQWSQRDNPASIHQTLSPDCPHFNPTILESTTQREDTRTSENEDDRDDVTVIEVVNEDEEKLDHVTCSVDTELAALTDQRVSLDVSKVTQDSTHVGLREQTSTLVSESANCKWDLFSSALTPQVDMSENVHHENFELEDDFFLSHDTLRHKEEAADSELMSEFHGCSLEVGGETPDMGLVSFLNIDGEENEGLILSPCPFEDNEVYDLSANSVYNGEDVTGFQIPVQVQSEISDLYYYEWDTYESDEVTGNRVLPTLHHSQELFQTSTDLGSDEPHLDVNEYSYSESNAQGEPSVHSGSFAGEQLGDSGINTTEDSDFMSDAHNT